MIQAVLGFATNLGERPGAWDEVYYTLHSNISDAILAWTQTSGLLNLQRTSMLGRRLQCLSSQCYLYYVRWSLVGTRGASQTQTYNIDGYRSSENYAGDACVFRCYTTDKLAHREIRLGGLPDNVVSDNSLDTKFFTQYVAGSNPNNANPGTFYRALLDNSGCIRRRIETLGGDFSVPIVGATKPTQYDNITLTLGQGLSFPANSFLDISVRGQPQLRGTWKSAGQPDSTHVILSGSQRVSAPAVFSGWATQRTTQGTSLGAYDLPYLSSHKLGKKKYQRRGRQSPKLLRH